MRSDSGRLYSDRAVVLRTYKLGEADRIVVMITRGHGKVRAVAKGVRKTKSKFGSRLEPTSHISAQLHEGRELDIVTQVESIDQFRLIREDLDRFTRASTMLEVVDRVVQERAPEPRLHDMLVGALRTLDERGSRLIVPAFFLKLLALEGYGPTTRSCAACGDDGPLVAFDPDSGGVLCRSCSRGTAISPEALALMQTILDGRLASVLDVPESRATFELGHLATMAVEHHFDHRLRSTEVLDRY